MATLSAIFQISCLLHLGQKGGRGAGVGVRCHKLGQYCAFSFFFFFFLPILIWNGVNSQSKSNKSQYQKTKKKKQQKKKQQRDSILRKGTSKTERHRGNIDPRK